MESMKGPPPHSKVQKLQPRGQKKVQMLYQFILRYPWSSPTSIADGNYVRNKDDDNNRDEDVPRLMTSFQELILHCSQNEVVALLSFLMNVVSSFVSSSSSLQTELSRDQKGHDEILTRNDDGNKRHKNKRKESINNALPMKRMMKVDGYHVSYL
eukprot:12903629-Ditylum_brightwellii.AAC.1